MTSVRPTAPLSNQQQRALELIRRGKSFLLCGHVRPDGDCIGAQAALSRVLEALGKRARILNPDPPSSQYGYLAREFDFGVFRGGPLPEHDVCVLVDIAELSRCGPLEQPLAAAPSAKLVIDHHLHHGEEWWDECFVDTRASASGMLVHRIARALGVELDRAAALALFTSLVTDTGWFKYSNTDAETLAAAADLVARGVDPHRVYQHVYQNNAPEQPRALSRLLARLEYHAGGRLAVIDLPAAEAGAAELYEDDMVLDVLRAVGAVEVVLFLREKDDGTWKLSARSKTDYDVNALARRFGGGGHAKASGATLVGPLPEVRARLIAAAEEGFAARLPAGGAAAAGDAGPGAT